MQTTCAGYIRVSSASQRDDSDSPASQRHRLEAAGCTSIYQDLAVSGFKPEQRRKAVEFQRLLTDIAEGRIARLLAVRLDRLARRDQIVIELAELCHRHGVEFATLAGGPVDVSTATGWLQTKVQSIFGEHYSRALSESVRSGYAGLHAQGIPARSAGSLPFHLQRQPGTRHGVEPSPHWSAARFSVQQLMERTWCSNQVGRYLHETCGLSGESKSTRYWLRSAALAGHMAQQDGTIVIRSCWPALVTDAERQQILSILEESRRSPPARGQTSLLSGICRCAICGGTMSHEQVRRPSGTYQYLRCSRATCNRRTVPVAEVWETLQDMLDQHIEQLVARRAKAAAIRQEPVEVTTWRRELAAREALPADLRQQSDRRRIEELRSLIAAAERMPAVVEDWWPDGLGIGSVQFWTQRPAAAINADLRRLIARVPVDPATRTVGEPEWRD